jgi:methylmalonyl-CoA mutase C-terminal domain/subunit
VPTREIGRLGVTTFTVWQHRCMAEDRIVVGAIDDDDVARANARRLRDRGHEVVFVGGQQTPEHLVRTAVAEDAVCIVVHDADDGTLQRIRELCVELDLEGVTTVREM